MGKRRRTKKARKSKHNLKLGTIASADLDSATSIQAIAFRVFVIYMQSKGVGLERIWKERRLDGDDDTSPFLRDIISNDTLRTIAHRDKWATRRAEHWRTIERKVMAELESASVKREIAELESLEAIESTLLSHVHGVIDGKGKTLIEAVRPKSLEGAVGAIVKLGTYRDRKRERVQHEISRNAAADYSPEEHEAQEIHVMDNLTDDEVLAAARLIAGSRAGITQDKEDDGQS